MNSLAMLVAFCLGGWFFGEPPASPAPPPSPAVKNYVEGEMLVKFKPGVSRDQIEAFNQAHGVRVLGVIEGLGIYKLGLPPGATVEGMIQEYQQSPLVDYAEPNHRIQLHGGAV